MAVQVAPSSRVAEGGDVRLGCDVDSSRLFMDLRNRGLVRERAVERLHRQLLGMAYARLLSWHPPLPRADLDATAVEAAGDALVAVLAHLDDFRGASRFTTWACRFALTEVSAAMRKRHRQLCEVPTDPDVIVVLAGSRRSVEDELEQATLLRSIVVAVNELLSARQRELLLALAIHGSSPQELACARGSTVGALYKSLHDAREKLRAHVQASGSAWRADA